MDTMYTLFADLAGWSQGPKFLHPCWYADAPVIYINAALITAISIAPFLLLLQLRLPKELHSAALQSSNDALVFRDKTAAGMSTTWTLRMVHYGAGSELNTHVVYFAVASGLPPSLKKLAPWIKEKATLTKEPSYQLKLPARPVEPIRLDAKKDSKYPTGAHEYYFAGDGSGVFPPRAPELHSLEDYVDSEGADLPSGAHPYGCVPCLWGLVCMRSARCWPLYMLHAAMMQGGTCSAHDWLYLVADPHTHGSCSSCACELHVTQMHPSRIS